VPRLARQAAVNPDRSEFEGLLKVHDNVVGDATEDHLTLTITGVFLDVMKTVWHKEEFSGPGLNEFRISRAEVHAHGTSQNVRTGQCLTVVVTRAATVGGGHCLTKEDSWPREVRLVEGDEARQVRGLGSISADPAAREHERQAAGPRTADRFTTHLAIPLFYSM
jgi:hypothetical protein